MFEVGSEEVSSSKHSAGQGGLSVFQSQRKGKPLEAPVLYVFIPCVKICQNYDQKQNDPCKSVRLIPSPDIKNKKHQRQAGIVGSNLGCATVCLCLFVKPNGSCLGLPIRRWNQEAKMTHIILGRGGMRRRRLAAPRSCQRGPGILPLWKPELSKKNPSLLSLNMVVN